MEKGTIDYYAKSWGAGRITPDSDPAEVVTFLESAVDPAGGRPLGGRAVEFQRNSAWPSEATRVRVL